MRSALGSQKVRTGPVTRRMGSLGNGRAVLAQDFHIEVNAITLGSNLQSQRRDGNARQAARLIGDDFRGTGDTAPMVARVVASGPQARSSSRAAHMQACRLNIKTPPSSAV